MNGITSTGQGSSSNFAEGLPPSSFETLDRLNDGFVAPPPEMTRSQWLEQARNSTNPATQAYLNELITLAGGRTDDAALNQVIDRFQALQVASTASELAAAQRGVIDQIRTALQRFDPLNNLLNLVQPQIADMARTAGLEQTEWGASLQGILDNPGTLSAFNNGLRQGMLNGAKDLVVGTLELAGKTLQYSADSGVLGDAGDWLRDNVGGLGSGAFDAIIPSAARGEATTATLDRLGSVIGDYARAVAANPGRLKTDIANALDAQWSSLKDAHAAAAALGPEAEAQWFGEAIGRVTFEVASTFIPVAGQAGKASRAANVAADVGDAAVDATRLANRADGARLAEGADNVLDAGRAARAGRSIDHAFGSNSVRYTYDSQGRLASAKAELSEVFSGLDRSNAEKTAQRDVARLGQAGDQGGHAVGHRFLSDQGGRAMFPQNGTPRDVVIEGQTVRLKNLNGGAFLRLENEIADWIKAGGKVEYEISFSDFDGVRPGRIEVKYSVKDADGDVIFKNTQGFKNEAGQSFDRISAADMPQYFE